MAMRAKLFSSIVLAGLVFGFISVREVSALSCAPISPVVGIVANIIPKEYYTEIALTKSYNLNDDIVWNVNETFSIDRYESIVKEYVRNNYQLSEKVSERGEATDTVSVPADTLNQTQIKNGDIIIKGPPIHVCDYGFIGLFGKDGALRSAIIKDNYDDYSYRNSLLEVAAGRELECNIDEFCKMEVNFKLDGKSFRLSPGHSHKSAGSSIKSISLLDSGGLKKRIDGTTVFDWGFNTYATYVLDFSDSEIQPIPTPVPTQRPLPTHEPQPLPEPTSPFENPNFFQRAWRWFVSLFR